MKLFNTGRRATLAMSLTLAAVPAPAADGPLPPPTAAYDATAAYRAVHIDTLDALFWPRFEAARVSWVALLKSRDTTDGRGAYYVVDGHSLVSLRSIASYAEYPALQKFRAGVAARLGPTGQDDEARYDAGDVALRTPHASEMWQRDRSFDYLGAAPILDEYSAGYARVVYESVTSSDFERAWADIDQALAKAHYPLTRIGFASVLGSGREISFWLASSRAQFDAAGTPYAAVVSVLGEARTIELFTRVRRSSTDQVVQEWVTRRDLWSPP